MAERGILQQAYGQLIPQGMQPNYAAPRTSVEPTPMVERGEIRPYTFSWRDMARQWLGSIGMSDNTANAVITLADITPVGAAFVGNEARRAVGRGERLAPAAEVALAAAPLPMAAKRAASKVVREVAQEVPTITAYHGSPHTFDRFDMSKIGTGEGAQAYGHGLYFAENEKVARGYRDALTNPVDYKGMGYPGADTNLAAKKVADAMGPNSNPKNVIASEAEKFRFQANELRSKSEGQSGSVRDANERLAASFDKISQDILKLNPDDFTTNTGSMYQVSINANPEDFLDWDKPLGQQSKKVQDVVNRVARDIEPYGLDKIANNMRPIEMQRLLQDPQGISALSEKGIPGIKYLDQGSRAAGQGSRNFVVFDDKLINILKRYSWVPGMAIPAAAIQEYTAMYGVAPNLGGQPPID